ncbi:helix-turn-helix domain-containing protein [Rhizobium leguminosarum]|uniref:helix-turn-helix domain-containing protein n=1 Tax=Rhizobium leguminosarum TaxID=384 RepID=UPI001C98E448|nr:AraC family transcriptional regulator [Rhizobium leguminosarum]MBY5794192.1 helix-turn-helix transcriptional regulator [Rhizobium leguminosarum]
MPQQVKSPAWQLTRPPNDHLKAIWSGGYFETARRGPTVEVEGRIAPDHHLIMVTLNGGANQHRFRTDDGFRYDGRDTKGMVSFLPAGCGRDLVLRNVAWEWGAIAIDPMTVRRHAFDMGPFLIAGDDFIYGMAAQMSDLLQCDRTLDQSYCSSMALALTEYLSHHSRRDAPMACPKYTLTVKQLRETHERVDGRLSGPIAICDLATPLGISEGHFFRAFRGATGQTPLQAISARRMDRAAQLLTETDLDVTEIAARCGIESPSHFARLFRAHKGISPSGWRRL